MPDTNATCDHHHTGATRLGDLVMRSAASVIFIVVVLFLLRPVMVGQMLARADAYTANGLYDDAVRQCDKALLIQSDNADAWTRLGYVQKAKGQPYAAAEAFSRAIEKDPQHEAANYERGMLHMLEEHCQLAVPYFERIRQAGPSPASANSPQAFPYHKAALDMLVVCYERLGCPGKAAGVLLELEAFYPGFERRTKQAPPPSDP